MASILILEDDEELRPVLRAVLAADGHLIHEAGTAAAARAVLALGTVDLAVVDGVLPDGDGVEFIEHLRALGNDAKVLFLSSRWSDPPAALRLEALGVSQVLQKPVLPSELARCVARELRPEPAPESLRRSPVLAELAALGAAYGESLGLKLEELRAKIHAARAAGIPSPFFQSAMSLSHKLHGTAGTYGFSEISLAGATVEESLRSLLAGAGNADVLWARMHEALNRAEALPRAPSAEKPERAPGAPAARVLVVDDDPAFLREIELVGKALSLDVLSAVDAASAIELARREPIDVALVDAMPEAGEASFDLVSRLRGLPGCAALPVACVSADGSMRNRLLAVRAGGGVFLKKPIEAHQLSLVVRRLLDDRDTERFRVLVVGDPDQAAAVGDVLRREGWESSVLPDADDLFDALGEVRPDLLVVVGVPTLSGPEVCRIVRASPTWQDLPVVLLADGSDAEAMQASFVAGADDCVAMPLGPRDLVQRVRLRLERGNAFRKRAFEDPLTGLLTRGAFSDLVVQRLAEAARRTRPLTIALLDLDRFKHINDTFGHVAGDRVLRGLGRLLRSRFRTEDVRGRWGGEEFVVALYEETLSTTALALERALAEFRGLVFQGEPRGLFSATFSAGVACFPEDGRTLDELVRTADVRLYAAKRAGRNRILAATPER